MWEWEWQGWQRTKQHGLHRRLHSKPGLLGRRLERPADTPGPPPPPPLEAPPQPTPSYRPQE